MFNVGGGELIAILIIALIVLGPDKLPDAVRRAGRIYGELRRMSSGFQAELRDALDDPLREVRSTTDLVKSTFTTGLYDHEDVESEPGATGATDLPDTTGAAGDEVGSAAPGFDGPGADDLAHVVVGDRPEALPAPVGAADSSLPPPPRI